MGEMFMFFFLPDIDECSDGSHTCDTNAACTNEDASYTCTCNAGWTGSGNACTGNLRNKFAAKSYI